MTNLQRAINDLLVALDGADVHDVSNALSYAKMQGASHHVPGSVRVTWQSIVTLLTAEHARY